MSYYDLTPEVIAISKMDFRGHTICPEWLDIIVNESGRTDMLAVYLFSDFIYWHKPQVIRDEITGKIIAYKKRFKADLLQRDYKQMALLSRHTERQCRDSIVLLEKLGLIKREFRTINVGGRVIPNTLFIRMMPEKIKAMNNIEENNIDINSLFIEEGEQLLESLENPRDTPRKSEGYPTKKRDTYTDITNRDYNKPYNPLKRDESETIKNVEKGKEKAEKLIDIWNQQIPDQKCELRDSRKNKLMTRFKKYFNSDESKWAEFCQKISKTPFLRGENDRGYVMTIDDALKPEKLERILDNGYSSKKFVKSEISTENVDKAKIIAEEIEKIENHTFKEFQKKNLTEYGADTYFSWMKCMQFENSTPNLLTISVPTKFIKNWIETHYKQQFLRYGLFENIEIIINNKGETK